MPVKVNVPTNDLLEPVTALGTERPLDHRLTGEAELYSLFFPKAPFEREGKLALPRIPASSCSTPGAPRSLAVPIGFAKGGREVLTLAGSWSRCPKAATSKNGWKRPTSAAAAVALSGRSISA